MKKLVLALAAAAVITAATVSSASALTIIKPIGGGGWHPHFGGGLSFGVGMGVDPGFSVGPSCYTAYRKVLVPKIGIVMKKTLVCA